MGLVALDDEEIHPPENEGRQDDEPEPELELVEPGRQEGAVPGKGPDTGQDQDQRDVKAE